MSEPLTHRSAETIEAIAPVSLEPVYEVTMSPSIGKLVLALAKAQLNFKAVLKQNENEAFKRGGRVSKYADLATYIDATQEALAKEELVVLQWPDVTPEAKSMTLVSILAHSSGEWMRGRLTLPAMGRDGFTAQSCGSSITYARRYSYAAITGCASEDDDGNAASGRGTSEAAQAVGAAKVAELKAKKANGTPAEAHKCLFFVLPEAFNGNTAELVNVKAFGETLNEVAAEGLRVILKKYVRLGKQNGELYLNSEKLPLLMDELKECGVELRELQAP